MQLPQVSDVCPTCKFPLHDTAHGWLKDYSKHLDHTGHTRKMGYCEVPCPLCTGPAEQKRVAKEQALLVETLFHGSQIPFKARNWNFSTLPGDADQIAYKRTAAFVRDILEGNEDCKRGLFLSGGPGRCKTSLAISALKHVMEAGKIGLFVSTPDLMNKIRATFSRGSDTTQDQLLQALGTVEIAVFDDLGVEKPSAFVIEQFYLLVDSRWNKGLWTIFTSNMSVVGLEKYWRPEGLPQGQFHPGVRVVERLREYCNGLEVRGRNQRELLREA